MNTLSWLVYVADVAPRLTAILMIFGIGGVIAGVICSIVGRTTWARYGASDESWRETMATRQSIRKIGGILVILAPLSLFCGVLLPSSNTIYMIAASEAGEAVVTSPDAVEMLGDLKAIIKKRLKEELGEAK